MNGTMSSNSNNTSSAAGGGVPSAAAAVASGVVGQNDNATSSSSQPPPQQKQQQSSSLASAAAPSAVTSTAPLPIMTSSANSNVAPSSSTTTAAATATVVTKTLSGTAYYDNLKTKLLSTTSSSREGAFNLLSEFVTTHPLMVNNSSNSSKKSPVVFQGASSNNEGAEKVSSSTTTAEKNSGGTTTTTTTASEYSTFLNAILPVFHTLLINPAGTTSLSLLEKSKGGSSTSGSGSGGGNKKGGEGGKKKKKTVKKKNSGGDKDDDEGGKKKNDKKKSTGGGGKKEGNDSTSSGNDKSAVSSSSTMATATAAVPQQQPVPPPPLEGVTMTTTVPPTTTTASSATTATTTATTSTAADNKTKGGNNSGGGKKTKASSSSTAAQLPPPPVPACYIPINPSISSIEYQIRHLILTILMKLPLTMTTTTKGETTGTGGGGALKTTTSSLVATASSVTASSSSSSSTTTTTTIRPNHILTILSISLHTFLEDYEPNAIIATELLYKFHLHLGNLQSSSSSGSGGSSSTKENAKLMRESQLLLDFVIGTFKDMGKIGVTNISGGGAAGSSGVGSGEGWWNKLFGVESSSSSTADGSSGSNNEQQQQQPLLKSKQSFKILAELPSIIKVLFQFHPKLYKSNAVLVIPALMEGLKLSAPSLPPPSATTETAAASSGGNASTAVARNTKSPTPSTSTAAAASQMTPVPDPTRSTSYEDSSPSGTNNIAASTSTSPSLLSTSSKSNNNNNVPQQLSPYEIQKRLYYTRTMALLTMQVRILVYLTSLVRKAFVTKSSTVDAHVAAASSISNITFKSNDEHHHNHHNHDLLPWASSVTVSTLIRPHEDVMATLIIQLLRNCPREDVIIRKELLLCTRSILSIPEFRSGFFRHIDNMLDERILVGCTTALVRGGGSGSGGTSGGVGSGSTLELQSIIRPLGYTVLAEFLTHVRTKLTPAQLSRVIRIFSRLLHDTQTDIPISLQIMSIRLLLNLSEVAYLSKDPNVQVGRDLLVRILMTVVQKLRTLKDKIPKMMDDAEHVIKERVKRGDMVNEFMLDVKEEKEVGNELLRVEQPQSLVVEDATFDGDYHGDPLFIVRDVQSLLQPIMLRMRNLFFYISTYSHHVDKEMRKSTSAGEERYPLPPFVTNRENDEVFSATLKLTQGERDIVADFLMSGISCLKLFRMDVEPDLDPSLMKPYDKLNPSPKFREVCDAFAVIFTGIESHNFARIVAPNLSQLLDEIDNDNALVGIFSSMLLDSRGVGKSHSYDLCAVLVPYILENIDKLGEYEEKSSVEGSDADALQKDGAVIPTQQLTPRANTLFKLLDLAFSSLMKHPKNEAVFLPHLQKLTSECLKGSTRGPMLVPNPYSNMLRSMFRTISAGKFEGSYKELYPLVPTILNELNRMYTLTNDEPFRLIIINLCLTLPLRLSVLLPHLPLLLQMTVPALNSNDGELVNLGLRSLEFWVDNLHPDFLFPILAQQRSTMCDLMLALTRHLQPAPYPYGLLCLRLIGKLGGKNRLFLREILAQNCEGNESIAPRQLSLECEWQSLSQQSDLMSDDEPKVCSSSFLLPLPLDRAVDVLRLVAESPNIVKKGEKSDSQTTPTLIVDGHFTELLYQDPRYLDMKSVSVELMEDVKRDQSKAAFTVIKAALASVLDIKDGRTLSIDCSTNGSKDDEKPNVLLDGSDENMTGDGVSDDVDADTNAFQRICDGLFAATAHNELYEEAMGLLKGVAAHVFLVVSSNEKEIIRIDSDGSTTDPFESPDDYDSSDHIDGKIKPLKPFGCFRLSGPLDGDINPLVFNKSLVDAFSGGSSSAATEVMHFVLDMFQRINKKLEGKSNSFGQVLFEHLLSEFCLACCSGEWNSRSGVIDGLVSLMRKMGVDWCKHFEVALLHTAIFVVKDTPCHIAMACKDSMSFFVQVTAFFYGAPASWEGSPEVYDVLSPEKDSRTVSPTEEAVPISKAALTLVVAEIASTNALVRFAVRHFLRLVSNDFAALGSLLSDHVVSLKRLLFAKLLRTYSLPDLVAAVDAVAFINEAAPKLIPISDSNMISFVGELMKMTCIADGEISDKGFTSVVLIDKNGYAVNSDGESIGGNKSLVQPSSIFMRQTITLEDKLVGARVVVPAALNLGVQLRVSTLLLFRAVVRLDEFFDAEVQSQLGNLRPHIVALLFRSLVSDPPAAVLTSTSALKEALKLAETSDDAEDSSSTFKLPKDLIQECIKPILVNLRDHKKLSIPLLKGLTRLLALLSSWFNKSLGDKMLEHLQRFLEPNKIIELKLWRSGEEPLVAAAVMDLFSELPQASGFVEALVKTTIRLESVLSSYGSGYFISPFRDPLSRYLNKHCAGTVGFFLAEHRLSNPMYNDLFFDILKRDDSLSLRQYLGSKECTVMMLNVCFERPLAIIRSEKQSPTTKAGSNHLSAYGINQWYSPTAQRKLEIARQAIEMKKKILSAKQQEEAKSKKSLQSQTKGGDKKSSGYQAALKSRQNVRDAYERAKKEVEDAKNAYARQVTTSFQQDSTQTRPMTTSALELQTQGFRLVEVLSQMDDQYLSQHNDVVRAMRWLWRSRGRHYRLLHEEEMPPRYHNESFLLSKFLVSYSKATPDDTDVLFDLIRVFLQPFASLDFSFIKNFLVDSMTTVLTSTQKSQVLQRFLTLLSGDGTEETKVLSCQMLIIPILEQGDPSEVFGDASLRLFVKLLLKDGVVFGSKLTCELLRVVIILLERMEEQIIDCRKDLLKYIWGILKADNSNTKYIGYLAVSKFVAAFETPPKVILQVYRSLLRSHSSVEKESVRAAMGVLLPTLPARLGEQDLEIALKYTVKVMHEEGDSLPQTAHLWESIIGHKQVFERFRVTIMPYMKHAVSLLGSHLHSHPEYRRLAACLAQLMIEWSDGGDAISLDQNIADALVNILVRVSLFNAESKSSHDHHRVGTQALALLQTIISRRKKCNIDPTHFHETTLALLSTPRKEKAHNQHDSPLDEDIDDQDRKASILRVCIHIFAILQRHDPKNDFIESNLCRILGICFSFGTRNNSKLSTMIENLVTCILTDGSASSELISSVTALVDNAIIESSNQIADTSLAVSIVEKVMKTGEVFGEPFLGSLHVLLGKAVTEHLKKIVEEENANKSSLMKQGKGHQLSATPTSGIFATACGLHFKETGSSKDMQSNDSDPRNQLTIDGEHIRAEIRVLITCIMLIGSGKRPDSKKGFIDTLLALLNSSTCLPVLIAVVSTMGKWLLANSRQSVLKKSERSAMLSGMARFNFERLSELESRYLSDQICCFVLSACGYNRSVIVKYPFGLEQKQSDGDTSVSPDHNLLRDKAFQKLFVACLLSANQYIRTMSIAVFGMEVDDCVQVHGKLSKLANDFGCGINDSIDTVGIPCRSLEEFLARLLGCDFECLGGRLWTTVVLDTLLATAKHQGGVTARALNSIHECEEMEFAGFMLMKSNDKCAQDSIVELRYGEFDDGIYSSFVEAISLERNEQLCGRGRCIAAVRKLIHGDAKTFQSLFEHCVKSAWHNLPNNCARTSLIPPLEALLAKPYHSQFTNNEYNLPKINGIQSMLRLLVKLRPIPILDTFLLKSLSSDYNAIYEVLTYFEHKYDALRKNVVDDDHLPPDLIKAIQQCYDALGERDVSMSISSAISSAQTKFALSLDKYGFVNEAVDAYGTLIDRAGDEESLMPSEDELHIWEQRWVESHKEMSQWSLIDEFASSRGEVSLSLEAAWKTKNWDKVKSLFDTPSAVALLEEGDQCAKMTEMFLAIHDRNLDAIDSIHAQIAQLCLYRWQLLPSISSGSQAHQGLLQQCTRLVELRESSQLMVETNAHLSRQTTPDVKSLLTAWKHRSPNLFDPISEWEDLLIWRSNMFDTISSNFASVDANTLATLHDRPHCCIALSRVARKQNLTEVSTYTLNSLGDSVMDVDSAFLKLREQVTTYQCSSENMLKGGLNLVNSTNVSYFSDRQRAEIFRLKAYFLKELRDKPKANQAYCQAVQICPNHARAWQDWGDLCVSLSDGTRKKLADDNADKKDLAKKASQYLSQAAGCYLEALRVDTNEQSRDRIPHCLSMLAADGRKYGSVCRTLEARGATTPSWCWLPWIPQLLSSLCRVEARAVKPILMGILKDHPQALYYSLRSFFLERRDIEKSDSDPKSDDAKKDENDSQSSAKLAEVIMSSLRKVHPVLWNRLEVILDNLIVRFRPSYESELLQTIIALISRTSKTEEKVNEKRGDNNEEEKEMEYYEKTLTRISDKFFGKSTSPSKKTLHFQARYGSLFESDFGQSNLDSFEVLVKNLKKWKSLLERQVSCVPTKCKLSETSPALSWFSAQAPDLWAGACSSRSLSTSNSREDSLSLPPFYDAARSSAIKAARTSSYAVLLAAQAEGLDGYSGGGAAAVEIPGQYAPTSASVFDSRPMPELHAKLVRFKQILEVISSGSTKQHVHRIAMIGSDGKEYKFLLQLAAPYSTRTDERSAQMQFIMGKTLRGDISACRRGLVVRPNVVIPLAQRMRMSATEDSHQSLESILNNVQRSKNDLPTKFQVAVDDRLSSLGDVDEDTRLSAEKSAKLEEYTQICQQQIASNILSKYMMQIHPSTESLCQFRKQFASQLAINSVLQYSLAVIERTPTRFVICNKTGQVLAQDMRSAYNHGLLEEQVVPFRLTRNITEFIGPFLLDGVFVPSFVSVCGAMSSRRNILEPMIHLLLRDDVISWYTSKTSSVNDNKLQDVELQLSDRVWKNVRFVQQRIDLCAPKRVENVAEAIKEDPDPIDMKVRTLVDAACSAERLSSMPASFQAWL